MPCEEKKSILFIQGEKSAAEEVQRRLEKYGYSVLRIITEKDAAVLNERETSVDLILIDTDQKDSLAAAEKIISLLKIDELPLLFVSSLPMPEVPRMLAGNVLYGIIPKDSLDIFLISSIQVALELYRWDRENKVKREALFESQENLLITLNSISDGVIATDDKGLIVRMNPVAERLSGWKFEEAQSKPLSEVFRIINSETREPAGDPVKIVLEKGEVVGLANHTLLIAKDGVEHQIADGCAPLKNSDDKLIGTVMVFRDVTEEYAIRKKIKESEKFLTAVFDSIQHGISVLDPSLNIITVNDTMKKWYAHSLPLEGKKCYEAYHGRAEKCEVCPTIQALKTGKMAVNEVPLVQNGEVTGVVELYAFPLTDEKGKITGVIEYVHNVTERKEAEVILKESEERNTALLEAIPDLMFTFNRKGVFIDYSYHRNDSLYLMPEDFLNKNVSQVLPQEVSQKTLAKLELLFRTKKLQKYEYNLEINGVLKKFESRLVLCGSDKALSIVRDISDQKRIEEELLNAKDELETYFDSSLDLLCIANTQGYFVRLNPEWQKVLGYSIAELEGKRFLDLVHPDDIEATLSAVSTLDSQKEILNFENRYLCRDGSYRWIEWRSKPQGSLIYAAARDVTERKKIEIELKSQLERESVISEISSLFVTLPPEKLKDGIDKALEEIGRVVGVDRCYIFMSDAQGVYASLEYEWCQSNLESRLSSLQKIQIDDYSWLLGKLFLSETVVLNKRTDLPRQAAAEKQFMITQDIQSFLALPILTSDTLVGFIGFDCVKETMVWQENQINMLRVVAEIFSGVLTKDKAQKQLATERTQFLSLFDSIEEAVYVADPATYEILYANRFMKKAFGKDLIGSICYKELQNKNAPCEFCTNKIISKNKGEPYRWEFYNPLLKKTFLITDRIIIWPDNREVRFELGIDITNRKKTEKALQKSEERYRLIAENTADFIWTTDLNLKFTYISSSVNNIRGYTYQEVLAQSLSEIHTPETLEKMLELFQQEMALEEKGGADPRRKQIYESEEYCKDGSIVTIENDVTFLRDDSGKAIGLLGISHNITERKKTEKRLQESQQRYEQLSEQSSTYIWEVDLAGMYSYLSTVAEKVIGYKREEIIGKKHFYDLAPPEDREEIKKHGLEVIQGKGSLHNFENKIVTRDGKVVWVITNGMPIWNMQGGVTGFRGSDTDITERKLAEEELKAQKDRLNNIIEGTNAGTWEWNLQSGEALFNEKFAELLGYTLTELSPTSQETWRRLVHPEDLWKDKEIFDEHLKGERGSVSFEVRMKHKSGNWIWVLDAGKVISRTEDGKPLWMYGTIVDINERKQAEEKLKSQKERLDNIIEGTNAGPWEWNLRKGEAIISEKWANILGYTLEELAPIDEKIWVKLLHPEDLKKNRELIKKHFNRETEYFSNEVRMKHKDGHWTWVLDKGKIISWTDDLKPLWMYGTIVDINDRKQAEVEIQSQRERLSNIIEGTNAGTWEWNVQTGETIYSEKWAELIGYTLDELSPVSVETWYKFAHPEDLKKSREIQDKHFRGELDHYSCEVRMKHKNGQWIWILGKGKLISRTAEGKPLWMFGTHLDITERKLAEEMVIKSEERAQKQKDGISQLVSDPAVISGDIEPSLKKIAEILAEALQVERTSIWQFSETKQELRCLTLYEKSKKEHSIEKTLRASVIPRFFETIARENRIRVDDIRKDPRTEELVEAFYRPLGITSVLDAAIQSEGKLIGLVCTAHVGEPRNWYPDEESFVNTAASLVSQLLANEQRKQIEETLLRVQKLDSIGKLAGGIAHDYNNMLMIILNYVETALQELKEGTSLHHYLTEIDKAAQRSAVITGQLLAFAKRQAVQPVSIDLNKTISELYKMMKNLIVEEIDFVWQPGKDLWQIKIDPAQIDQLLANLVINSQEAIKGKGKISIETSNVVIDDDFCLKYPEAVKGEFVCLKVKDTGCGMDENVKRHLFAPFFSTKKTGKNSGLGLSTVYGIVSQNKGLIIVNSKIAKGTTVMVYLPRSDYQRVKKEEKASNEKITGSETILLVDDEAGILEVVKPMLERFGYRVMSANSPLKALSLAKAYKETIDLLITDVVMPEMNGYELMGKVKELHPEIKNLFMTGYTEDVIVDRGVLQEGINFLQKPFLSKVLAEKVREVLKN
jgi:PAS domain S-box-containing protein